jgi:RNA polymerase sigma-70 factor (ECF subfamily)
MNPQDKHKTFGRIVESHGRHVFQLAFRMTGNEQDAEEVVQETFLKAYRGYAGYRGKAAVNTWLYRIATNCAIDLLRQRKRLTAEHTEIEPDHTSGPDSQTGQEARIMRRQFQEELSGHMGRLTAMERIAFVLRHYQDLPIAEIGETLEIKPNAVKQAIFRAVRKLRGALQKEPA